MKTLTFALLALGSASCIAPIVPRKAQFIEAEYAPYSGTGTGSIEGQAFVKTRGGDVKYGAGNPVSVNPVTTYSDEWYQRSIVGTERLSTPDERARPYYREVIADGEGRFRVEGLPPGDYYLACGISWEVPSSAYSTMVTGGWAHARAHVESDKTTKVIVTR